MTRLRRFSALLAGSAALLLPMAAMAQDGATQDEATGIDTTRRDDGTIVVTARRFVPSGAITASKTTAPLIETPQSVSVISRDQIDLLNFVDVQQATRYTAGVVGEAYGPDLRFDFLKIRGFIPVQYLDGLQAPRSSTISNVGLDLYGFEAIDILKGPAGVLYGTTPPGGIYNLTSRRPTSQLTAEIQAKYGTDDFKQVAGTVSGALTDGLSARITGLWRDRDSQTDFVTAKRVYVAPAVTAELGPDTKLTALGYYQYDRVNGDTNGFLPAVGTLFANPLGQVRRSINLGEPNYNYYRRTQFGIGYELTHRFSSALRFTQNARWSEYSEYQQVIYPGSLSTVDNRTVSRNLFPSKEDVQQFAIDSRLDAQFATGAIEHTVLLGLDYRNYRGASGFSFGGGGTIDLFNPVYGNYPAVTPPVPTTTSIRLKQTGAYLQDQAKIGNFILTLSGRHDWTSRDNLLAGTRTKDNKFTYRAGGTFVTESGIAPYVSYGTSFEPIVGQVFGGGLFVPSEGNQIEVGIKYDGRNLGDDVKLFATAALFRIRQTNVLTDDPNPLAGLFDQVQTGEVESKGFEFELVTRIKQQLSINASYTYNDAKVIAGNPVDIGARLSVVPRHKASLFVDYTLNRGALAGLGAGFGGRYLSSAPGIQTTAALNYASPETTLFDATIHYDIPGWRFAVNATNLFDKVYVGRCEGETNCRFGESRQVIGTVTKKF
jgi:iron complex outermembrane recepter protein